MWELQDLRVDLMEGRGLGRSCVGEGTYVENRTCAKKRICVEKSVYRKKKGISLARSDNAMSSNERHVSQTQRNDHLSSSK